MFYLCLSIFLSKYLLFVFLTLVLILIHSGILVPGGFGQRGTEGMMLAIKYARESKVPFLGICLGFQLAVIEWVRNVRGVVGGSLIIWYHDMLILKIEDATSTEFNPQTPSPVIIFMPEISKTHMGGTMRLGLRPTIFDEKKSWSVARKLYGGKPKMWERHRHRYEVNPEWVERIQAGGGKGVDGEGLVFVGQDEAGVRMQVCELQGGSFFLLLFASPYLTFSRPPILPSPPGPPRILFTPFEPVSAFLRVRSCFVWPTGVRRSTQGTGGELLAAPSGGGDGWGGGVEERSCGESNGSTGDG